MSNELEIAADAATGAVIADAQAAGAPHSPPHGHGGACANCGAILQGPFCHVCGQNADDHKRSILHLGWEAVEGFLHLDGRLLRTIPDLFFHPGRLARDYMDGRVARHVPPFRTFLVALLIFIFAAEYATHEAKEASDIQNRARAAQLVTPQGRAKAAAADRADAINSRAGDLADAAKDRAEDLADPSENRARVEARYASAVAKANADYADEMAKADRLAQDEPEAGQSEAGLAEAGQPEAVAAKPAVHVRGGVEVNGKRQNWFKQGIRRAIDNPEFYMTVMFAWGHRLAVLLLPIVGLSLALVYRKRREIFVYDHLLVAMNLMSFSFLTNAAALMLPYPAVWYALGAVALWTPVNLFQTLRGAYGSSIIGALLKTVIVWWVSVFSFFVLLTSLLVFALTQV